MARGYGVAQPSELRPVWPTANAGAADFGCCGMHEILLPLLCKEGARGGLRICMLRGAFHALLIKLCTIDLGGEQVSFATEVFSTAISIICSYCSAERSGYG